MPILIPLFLAVLFHKNWINQAKLSHMVLLALVEWSTFWVLIINVSLEIWMEFLVSFFFFVKVSLQPNRPGFFSILPVILVFELWVLACLGNWLMGNFCFLEFVVIEWEPMGSASSVLTQYDIEEVQEHCSNLCGLSLRLFISSVVLLYCCF